MVISPELDGNLATEAESARNAVRQAEQAQKDDVLAYFDHRASDGPTEAINRRLEALRRNALGFRNLTKYRIRSLLHCEARTLKPEESVCRSPGHRIDGEEHPKIVTKVVLHPGS